MKQTFNKWKKITLLLTIAIFAVGIFQISDIGTKKVSANNTPQTLPFTQNWTNIGLITVNDDWSGVPGIVGFLGDDAATTAPDIDPRTITQDLTTVDVNANQTNPDTFTSGGVTEFEITNPTIAFQGSGTADYSNIVIYLNTTGQSNINVAFNARDIDLGSDVVQQLNVQYRVGGTGLYNNVTGGYFADVTNAANTLVTPVSLTLPAGANNQSLVEVRIMTTNATGSDEFVGIDDISVTAGPAVVAADAPVDFNGDGKTDWVVVRNTNVPANQLTWFWNINGSAAATAASAWGLNTDVLTPADFDGDQKDDIAVWRPGAATVASFYILQSLTNTVRVEAFGQTGDNPTVVNDYNGDGKDDVAVYRAGTQGVWYYRTVAGGAVTFVPWGGASDFAAPGDWNGDGTADFGIGRVESGSIRWWTRTSTGIVNSANVFGSSLDFIITGDFDGDSKTDLATARQGGGVITWYWRPSGGGADQQATFGLLTDTLAPGDYDGDGKTDIGVFRNGVFYTRSTTSGTISFFTLGASGDRVPAGYNAH